VLLNLQHQLAIFFRRWLRGAGLCQAEQGKHEEERRVVEHYFFPLLSAAAFSLLLKPNALNYSPWRPGLE
jgi:hypothetical protein